MKGICRRVRKLEQEFAPVETYFTRQLRDRIDAGLRRVAEAVERGECEPCAEGLGQHSGLRSIREILQAARFEARNSALEGKIAG